MRKDFYVEVPTADEATRILSEIEKRKGTKWAEPISSPFKREVVFGWNNDELATCEDLITGLRRLSLDEALKRDYEIDYHRGRFAHASRKLEEARFMLDAIENSVQSINFPATRALFYGFQSAIYSTREALKRSCRKSGDEARRWWKDVETVIKGHEPFIQFMHVDYNRDKHGENSGLLSPSVFLYSYEGPAVDVLSGEGVYKIEERGTPRERRVFAKNVEADMSVRILFEPQVVKGVDVDPLPIEKKLLHVLQYYEEILVEAKTQFP